MDMELLIKVFMFESFVLWLSYFYAVNEETNIMESYELNTKKMCKKYYYLPDGESNPGLPRDRRGYLPLCYRGFGERGDASIVNVICSW